jgi:hypothetical protein
VRGTGPCRPPQRAFPCRAVGSLVGFPVTRRKLGSPPPPLPPGPLPPPFPSSCACPLSGIFAIVCVHAAALNTADGGMVTGLQDERRPAWVGGPMAEVVLSAVADGCAVVALVACTAIQARWLCGALPDALYHTESGLRVTVRIEGGAPLPASEWPKVRHGAACLAGSFFVPTEDFRMVGGPALSCWVCCWVCCWVRAHVEAERGRSPAARRDRPLTRAPSLAPPPHPLSPAAVPQPPTPLRVSSPPVLPQEVVSGSTTVPRGVNHTPALSPSETKQALLALSRQGDGKKVAPNTVSAAD